MKMSQLMTKVSLGVVLAGTLAVMTPSASYAFGEHQYYFQNEESDGTAWSYYRGYFSNESDPAVESHALERGRAVLRANRIVGEQAERAHRGSALEEMLSRERIRIGVDDKWRRRRAEIGWPARRVQTRQTDIRRD